MTGLHIMPTRIGFFLTAGLILGALSRLVLPIPASYGAIIGGVLGVLLALMLDKASKNKKAD